MFYALSVVICDFFIDPDYLKELCQKTMSIPYIARNTDALVG
jgi:hypothetical protein